MNASVAAWAAAAASASLLGLLLARGRPPRRLMFDALAIGLSLGAAVAVALAPFDLKTNPLHFSAQTLAFLFAGLPEEGIKMVGVAAFLRWHYLARDRRDVVFAAGALSLAFAALENLFYLANAGSAWATLALERALTATPFHVFEGLAGGFVVASAPPGARGVALALAAWLGLAAIHGVYDFAVFAGAPGAVAPEAFRRLEAALGGDVATSLRVLLCLAEAAAALVGGAAVAALGPRPTPPRGRMVRLMCSRGLGWLVGGALAGAAFVALGASAAVSAVGASDLFFRVAVHAVLPLALGLVFLLAPASPAPLSRRFRIAVAAVGGVAALAAVAAAWTWGPAEWRELEAARFEASGARRAAGGDYVGAVGDYTRALVVDPGRVDALSQRAGAYAALSHYDDALHDVDAALRAAPTTVALYVQRADVDRRREDYPAALVDFDQALRLRPGDPQLLAGRGQARLEAGDATGAGRDLAEARRLGPDNAVVRRASAAWSVDAGDLDAALRELNAALHENPDDVEAAFQRGRLWLYKDEPARALADFVRADAQPAFLYPALWRFFAEARIGRDAAANLRTRLAAAPDAWPAPVARLLIGEIDDAAARAAAGSRDERCEADFYFALARLGQESTDASAARLEAARDECPAGFIEHEGAKAELRRLGR